MKRIEIRIEENQVNTTTENVTPSEIITAIGGLIMTAKEITNASTAILMADVRTAVESMEKEKESGENEDPQH